VPGSIRSPLVGAAFAVLLASSAGCAVTSLTARNARVPVLVGPVACIGCPPVAPTGAEPAAFIADTVSHRSGYMASPFGQIDFGDSTDPRLNIESAASDPCVAEIHVTKLDARSFAVTAFVFGEVAQTVTSAALVAPVPSGTCAAPAAFGGALP
jgi:hypothetical protein